MATRLVRSYTLTPGKSVQGMGQTVKNFFCTYEGTTVTLYGIQARREIPVKLNAAIEQYLGGVPN